MIVESSPILSTRMHSIEAPVHAALIAAIPGSNSGANGIIRQPNHPNPQRQFHCKEMSLVFGPWMAFFGIGIVVLKARLDYNSGLSQLWFDMLSRGA